MQQALWAATNRLYAPGEFLGRLGLQNKQAARPGKLHALGKSMIWRTA
jgi:hypothetical protein